MNDTDIDIVARLLVLNHHAKKLADNESLHELHREAFTRCESLTLEAAKEIERLRGGGCARDQKSTQFCREAVDLQAELAACRVALEQAQKDRDDARRRYCHDVWQGVGDEDEQRQLTPREIAARMGWPWPRGGSEATK